MLPTLALMLSVFVANAFGANSEDKKVDDFLYKLTLGLSGFYVFCVAAVVFLAPLSTVTPLAIMKTSNIFLGPLQGLTALGLGVFFISATPVQNVQVIPAINPPSGQTPIVQAQSSAASEWQ